MGGRRLNAILTPFPQYIHNLIAQKDNALSMRDNATLRTISEDQKWIVLAATRDSAAMRRAKVERRELPHNG
jgi:hypothetical protein